MTEVLFSKHVPRLSWVCVFFPQVCWSSILQADLGSVSPRMLIGSRRSVAKHGRRCCCRTSEICSDHLTQVAIKANKPERATFPRLQTNEPVYCSRRNRYDDGVWIRFKVRYRSQSSINMFTHFYLCKRVKHRIGLLSLPQVDLWFGNYFTCHSNHTYGGGGG